MNHKLTVLALITSLAIVITGCGGSTLVSPIPTGADLSILVANSLGETLSLVERTDGIWSVQKDILATGQGANDIVMDGDTAFVICSLSNSIHVVDTATMTTVREISTGEGTNPFAGAMDSLGNLWVTLTTSNQLAKIDPKSSMLGSDVIDLPDASQLHDFDPSDENSPWPEGICIVDDMVFVAFANLSPAFVAGGKGAVAILDVETSDLIDLVTVEGMNTADAYSGPDGRIYFVSAGMFSLDTFTYVGNGLVEVFDPDSMSITDSVPLIGAPFEMTISETGAAFLTDGMGSGILRFDTSSLTAWPSISIPDSGMGMNYVSGICQITNELIGVLEFNGNALYVVDGVTGNVVESLDVGHGPDALALI